MSFTLSATGWSTPSVRVSTARWTRSTRGPVVCAAPSRRTTSPATVTRGRTSRRRRAARAAGCCCPTPFPQANDAPTAVDDHRASMRSGLAPTIAQAATSTRSTGRASGSWRGSTEAGETSLRLLAHSWPRRCKSSRRACSCRSRCTRSAARNGASIRLWSWHGPSPRSMAERSCAGSPARAGPRRKESPAPARARRTCGAPSGCVVASWIVCASPECCADRSSGHPPHGTDARWSWSTTC